jgi:hypothetical protein
MSASRPVNSSAIDGTQLADMAVLDEENADFSTPWGADYS